MIGLLLPLIIIGIIVAVVRASRGSEAHGDGGVQSLRLFVQYVFLLAATIAAANGLTRLLASALPAEAIAGRRTTDVALGLSLTLVAVPAWVLLWRAARRRLDTDPEERAAPAWGLYLLVAGTAALITGFVNVVQVGRWVVRVDEYRPDDIAAAVVWSGVWAWHAFELRHHRRSPTSRVAQIVVLAGCTVGVIALGVGVGAVLAYGFGQGYRAIVGPGLVEPPATQTLRTGLVVVVAAAAVWWWHWLHQAVHATRTAAWHAYVILVALLSGLLTAVTAAGVGLHLVLQWLLGDPDAASAAVHFEPLPVVASAAIVGGWAWWYHHAVLGDVAERRRSEPERVYEYLVAGVGLIAAASGVAVAIMALLQAVVPGALASADTGGRNTLVVAVTLLLVGGPLWWRFWHRLQRQVRTDEAAELASPSRRVYLFLLFAASGLTAVVSMSIILYTVFRDVLDGNLAVTVLHDLRAAIALVLTAGALSAYHWAVHRDDRAAQPAAAAVVPREVLLVSADGQELATVVAATTGARVRRLHRLDADPGPVDAEHISAAIMASPHQRVLVTVEPDGTVRVVPYDLS